METPSVTGVVAFVLPFVILIMFLIRLYQKATNAMCTSNKRLDGKTALVTGGTAGMGLFIARDFARRGARVIVACPFEQEGLSARKMILEETPSADVVFELLDLGSLKSVREFAEQILKTEDRLDLLINNAGIATPEDYQTEDGMNFVMQVNYFGHFLLTILLLPLLKKTGQPSEPSRIINTSSILHYIGDVNIENINKTGYYWPLFIYGNSKFCIVLFTRELSKKIDEHVVVNCLEPGAVGTGIWYARGDIIGTITSNLAYYFYKRPWEGAQTALHVALDDRAGAVSGETFINCKQSRARRAAYREELARELWDTSVKLVKLTEKELEAAFKMSRFKSQAFI